MAATQSQKTTINEINLFNTFLQERTIKNNIETLKTHSRMRECTYNITEVDIEQFWKLYNDAIKNQVNKNELINKIEFHILEQQKDLKIKPLIVDLDFKYSESVTERKHATRHIKNIVKLYMDEISNVLDISENDIVEKNLLHAYVFERNKPYQSSGYTKDSIHIMFPNVVTNKFVQKLIRTNILKKIKDILAELECSNDIPDIVNLDVIDKIDGWFLYGSHKKGTEPYDLTYIYDGFMNRQSLEEFMENTENIPKFFSIRDKPKESELQVKPAHKSSIEKIEEKELTKKENIFSNDSTYTREYTEQDIEYIRHLITILNPRRADEKDAKYGSSWLELGKILKSVKNNQILFDMWLDFSKKFEKYREGRCEKVWFSIKYSDGLDVSRIHCWAATDNLEEYEKIKTERVNIIMEEGLDKEPTHYDVAKVLHTMFEHRYCYTNKTWYMFSNHIWQEEDEDTCIRQKISNELYIKYASFISRLNEVRALEETADDEKEKCKKKVTEIMKLLKFLKTSGFKDNVVKECKELFYDKQFEKKLNKNLHLVGFLNGVYDLKAGLLRNGFPDDYISVTTNIIKIPFTEETKESDEWITLKSFIDTVFTNPNIRNYFLKFISTCLNGENKQEKFRIWTGDGSNGKSKIMELIVASFGEYAKKFPITLLTQKSKASGAASPEIATARFARFVYFEEPSGGEKMNNGLLKEYSGGDKITFRQLFGKQMEMKPQFKLSLLCNDIPEYDTNESMARRVEIIEFSSKFCDNPKEKNEFKIDGSISTKLVSWKEIFMAYLIDVIYPIYDNEGLRPPDEVTRYTDDYTKTLDTYSSFIYTYLLETGNDADTININDLYDDFKLWYVDQNAGKKIISKKEFTDTLKKKYKKKLATNKTHLKGFKINPNKDGYVIDEETLNELANADADSYKNAGVDADDDNDALENSLLENSALETSALEASALETTVDIEASIEASLLEASLENKTNNKNVKKAGTQAPLVV